VEHNLVSEWDFLYNKAHNELLNFLANSGIVGLLTYLGLFVMIFYLGIRERAFGFLAGILAMFISNFFGFSTVVSNLLLFGFFAMVILPEHKKIDSKGFIDINEYYYYLIVLLGGLFVASKIFFIWQADYLFTKGQNTFNSGNYKVGLPLIQEAIKKAPKEAFLYDELASSYSQLSIAFASEGQSTASTQLAQSAIESNLQAIRLNPAHLNFYKNQARIYIRLGQMNPKFYSDAKESLEKAISLAPTDAKLYYNLALVLEIMGDKEQALQKMEYSVAIKSNYLQARGELARIYFQRGELQKAKDQYVYSLEKIAPDDKLVQEKLKVVEASLSANNQ
jgi:tetratricopeptide (TPR) repeat protein